MPNHWYIARGGVREGPIAEDILLGWAADGSLRPHDLVWREGLEAWARADAVPGLLAPPPLPATVVESSTPGPPPSAGRKSPPSGMLYVLLALNILTCLVPTVWLLAVDSLDAFPDLSGFTWRVSCSAASRSPCSSAPRPPSSPGARRRAYVIALLGPGSWRR